METKVRVIRVKLQRPIVCVIPLRQNSDRLLSFLLSIIYLVKMDNSVDFLHRIGTKVEKSDSSYHLKSASLA